MSRRPALLSNHDNQYGAGYDALVAKYPAEIVWRRNPRGVLVAVSVRDPLAERDHNSLKTHCVRGHEFNEDNTRWKADGTRECCTCKRLWNRARSNPDLMRAAGRQI